MNHDADPWIGLDASIALFEPAHPAPISAANGNADDLAGDKTRLRVDCLVSAASALKVPGDNGFAGGNHVPDNGIVHRNFYAPFRDIGCRLQPDFPVVGVMDKNAATLRVQHTRGNANVEIEQFASSFRIEFFEESLLPGREVSNSEFDV